MHIFRVSQVTEQHLSVKWWKMKATCDCGVCVSSVWKNVEHLTKKILKN